MSSSAKQSTCSKVFFGISLMIAVGYGLMYYGHEIGVSPFHISRRLPGLDQFILFVTVILPLFVGIVLGCLAGRLRWFVLPLYPVVIALSLF